ncbi:MAG: TetR/AcrR family transcriptional regulator [Beijerinckiaceae bacterium]
MTELAPSQSQRLVQLAEEEVRRVGFKRLTVVSVAEAAGMTHANVYRYFPSKIALADAVTTQWLKPIESALSDATTASDPALDKLGRMIVVLANAYRSRLDEEPELFLLFADAMAKARPVARKHRARIRQLTERVMDEAIGDELFDRRLRNQALALLFDGVHRFLTPASLLGDREVSRADWDGRLARLLDAVLNSLAQQRRNED